MHMHTRRGSRGDMGDVLLNMLPFTGWRACPVPTGSNSVLNVPDK
jgi:hypothetical protein